VQGRPHCKLSTIRVAVTETLFGHKSEEIYTGASREVKEETGLRNGTL